MHTDSGQKLDTTRDAYAVEEVLPCENTHSGDDIIFTRNSKNLKFHINNL